MDIFFKVKNIVKTTDIAQAYLNEPIKRSGDTYFYYSPFRTQERTASLAVNDKKQCFTDFGTGKRYDIFDFVSEIENCDLRDACIKIANHFNIDIEINKAKSYMKIANMQLQEEIKIQNAINNWFYDIYDTVSSCYKYYRELAFTLPIGSKSLPFIYRQIQKFEYLTDIFYNDETKNKLALYKDRKRYEVYERERGVF